MTETRAITYQVGGCRMVLFLPDAMEDMTLMNLRKFFKWASQNPDNDEAIADFFEYVPILSNSLKEEWSKASIDFQRGYQDPNFASGRVIMNEAEKRHRKAHNASLRAELKKAKARYERFQKKAQKLKELQEKYG